MAPPPQTEPIPLLPTLSSLPPLLNTLTSSLSTNPPPSIPATHALLASHTALLSALDSLSQHQQNQNRIRALQTTIADQNLLIREQLGRLVEVREGLVESGGRGVVKGERKGMEGKDVTAGEVLNYAKRIARFTAPAHLSSSSPLPLPLPLPLLSSTSLPANDNNNPATKAEDQSPDQTQTQPQELEATTLTEKEGRAMKSLEDFEKQWLDPASGWQFTPWPSEEVLRRGGLGELQVLGEGGVRAGEEGVEGVVGDGVGVEVGGEGEAEKMVGVRGGGRGGEGGEVKKEVFGGLDLYDPDEE